MKEIEMNISKWKETNLKRAMYCLIPTIYYSRKGKTKETIFYSDY